MTTGSRTIVPFSPSKPSPTASSSGLVAEPTFPADRKEGDRAPCFAFGCGFADDRRAGGMECRRPKPGQRHRGHQSQVAVAETDQRHDQPQPDNAEGGDAAGIPAVNEVTEERLRQGRCGGPDQRNHADLLVAQTELGPVEREEHGQILVEKLQQKVPGRHQEYRIRQHPTLERRPWNLMRLPVADHLSFRIADKW